LIRLRPVTADDADEIAQLYAPYVADSVVSFETDAPDAAEMSRRIEASGGLYPWIAAFDEEGVLAGYCYATHFRARRAYRFTVETSVYVRPSTHRRGVGRQLYRSLLATLEAQGFTQALAAISLPNLASIALHEALGYRSAGTHRQIGYKLGEWHDVGLWQRPLAEPLTPPREPRSFADVGLQFMTD
jgi:phosphinothricin acetyltransferase